MITKEQVYEALQDCYDPEIPVNIVDLGLVYDVEINDDKVAVKMTLTAPGCGMGTMIAADAKQKIMALEGVARKTINQKIINLLLQARPCLPASTTNPSCVRSKRFPSNRTARR
jgi:metal-sulfur cluster biosynthetic enzyme